MAEDTQGDQEPGEGAANTAGEGQNAGGGEGAALEYLSKAEFEGFRNEVLSTLKSGQDKSRDDDKPDEPDWSQAPDMEKYDFEKDPKGSSYKYMQDMYKHFQHLNNQESAKSDPEKAAKELEQTHLKRARDYIKENPEFDADVKKYGSPQLLNGVRYAIYAHPESASIGHYIIKNRKEAEDLEFIYQTDGQQALMYRVGELAAKVREEKSRAKANRDAASDGVPRMMSFGSEAAVPKKSNEELYKEFHS